jgi:HPt (histidine-containing phosphotransfer) domain-containing protein
MTKESNDDILPLVDAAVLDELRSIMEDEFTEVLQIFLDESVTLMSEIHTAFEEESENLTRAAHTLKSCSKNVGAMRLGSIAETIEKYLIDNDFASAKNKLDELQDVFTQSHTQVKKCMQDDLNEVA